MKESIISFICQVGLRSDPSWAEKEPAGLKSSQVSVQRGHLNLFQGPWEAVLNLSGAVGAVLNLSGGRWGCLKFIRGLGGLS